MQWWGKVRVSFCIFLGFDGLKLHIIWRPRCHILRQPVLGSSNVYILILTFWSQMTYKENHIFSLLSPNIISNRRICWSWKPNQGQNGRMLVSESFPQETWPDIHIHCVLHINFSLEDLSYKRKRKFLRQSNTMQLENLSYSEII